MSKDTGSAPAAPRSVSLPVQASPTAGHRLPTLDGIRGLAILLVMLYHQTLIEIEGSAGGMWRGLVSGIDGFAASVAQAGWCGVDLFFVLSGFLITGILLDTRESPHYFRNFYVRRALRIFPLYYAVVVVSLMILPNFHHAKNANFERIAGDEVWYWVYLSNFSIARHNLFRHGILDISWSLAIEEQFYLIWPAVVLLCGRRNLLRVCVGLLLLSLGLRGWMTWQGAGAVAIYVLTFTHLDGLAVGAIVALLARQSGMLERLRGKVRAVTGLCMAGLIFLACRFDFRGGLDPRVQVPAFSLLAFFFGGLLVLTLLSSPLGVLSRLFNGSILRILGKYSYAIYLFHLPVRAAVRDLFLPGRRLPLVLGSALPAQLLFYLVSTLLTLGAAWLSWELYERHFLKLKRYFESSPTPAAK